MAKVLLIDDEVTMVQMVTEILRREGHEVFPVQQLQRRRRDPGIAASRIGHH